MSGFNFPGRVVVIAMIAVLLIDCNSDLTGPSSGKLLWHQSESAPAGHAAAFDSSTGEFYYVATKHRVIAVDANGVLKWQGRTFPNLGVSAGYRCAIAGELVVCNDSGLVALRRSNGDVAWRFTSPDLGLYRVPFVVRENSIYVASAKGSVYALDAATGVQRWIQAVPVFSSFPSNVTGLAADASGVYAAYTRFNPNQGGMMAVDPQTGSRLWLLDFPAAAPQALTNSGAVALWNDLVLAVSADGRIHGIDKARGWEMWTLPTGQASGEATVLMLHVSGSMLYAASKTNAVIGYDLQSQKQAMRIDLEPLTTGAQVACGGDQCYVTYSVSEYPSTYYDVVAAFIASGRVLWKYTELKGALLSGPPAVASDRIMVASSSGVWAFSR